MVLLFDFQKTRDKKKRVSDKVQLASVTFQDERAVQVFTGIKPNEHRNERARIESLAKAKLARRKGKKAGEEGGQAARRKRQRARRRE